MKPEADNQQMVDLDIEIDEIEFLGDKSLDIHDKPRFKKELERELGKLFSANQFGDDIALKKLISEKSHSASNLRERGLNMNREIEGQVYNSNINQSNDPAAIGKIVARSIYKNVSNSSYDSNH